VPLSSGVSGTSSNSHLDNEFFMNTEKWHIAISHPDYCPDPHEFSLSTDQLKQMTSNCQFGAMIEDSAVLGGLIAAVEATQHQTN
jgi:hypothetical protein